MGSSTKKKILVLGGGFAGLEFCRRFKDEDTSIMLVDKKNHHLFQPLLYQVATSGLSAPQIAQPLRGILRGRDQLTTYLDEIQEISLEGKFAKGKNRIYEYDYLVLGLGAKTSYFGNDHWAEHTHGLKTLNDALGIRNHVLRSLEMAEMETDSEKQKRLMTFIVVGGGPTGVEMAGALAELGRHVLNRNFRHIDPKNVRVILVEGSDKILGNYSDPLPASAQKQIEKLGVEVRCGNMVEDIRAGELDVGGETIYAGTIIWGAGVEAVPLTKQLGAPLDRAGRIKVCPDCSIPGHPEAFAIGDIAHLVDTKGKPVPGVSPAALQMAKHISKIIAKEIETGQMRKPEERKAFTYFNKGNMATIGRSKAIAEIGKLKMSGMPAWMAWLVVHLIFLVGFRNRIVVLLDWFYSYINYRRSARIIFE
ncbi:NAD(P)/FAD-dependent oxidoreductase [Puniceicoccus vermicola]|uniref:NADH:ubiquinone reductase (non-electrogenic) n=1 Tax=Puniceicoccus vermicola TaxID=388746 RepID=A0A7X1AVW3_9BACT|nr:NAD(P)/FAD-dependent oxidoreductase [Puniceicoccus vermicola]MBC2600912.1 NAD(P)/FAD-dependent oxidoreductase [Puniceicoccus vermicola]